MIKKEDIKTQFTIFFLYVITGVLIAIPQLISAGCSSHGCYQSTDTFFTLSIKTLCYAAGITTGFFALKKLAKREQQIEKYKNHQSHLSKLNFFKIEKEINK